MHYIYKITNLINQKVYIGQAKDFKQRWRQHKQEAKKEKPSMIVNQAMKKYGIDNFSYEIVACCLDFNAANEAETAIVKQEESHISLGRGYNVSNGGANAPKTETWKQHMSQIMTGREIPTDTRRKISESLVGRYVGDKHPLFGTHHTDSVKDVIREKRAKQVKEKGLPWPKGSKHSEASKQLMSVKNSRPKPKKKVKITMEIANQIREEYNSMSPTYQELSEKYGLCIASICGIVNNKKWIKND